MKRKILGFIIGVLVSLLFIILLLALGYAIENNEKFVPVVVGLMSVFSGLGGVWITNYFNNINQKERLEFESNQKETERSFNLKKDIYLNAVDDLIGIHSLIGQVPNLEFDFKKSNEQFLKFCYSMNRLQLIANVETTKQTIQVTKVCSKLYFLMLKERKDLIDLTAELNAIKPYIKVYENERNKALDLIKENEFSKHFDHDLNKKLWNEYNNNEKRRRDLEDENLRLLEESNLEIHKLNEIFMNGISDAIVEINKLNVLIRKDLRGGYMIKEFEDILFDSSSEALNHMKEMVRDFEENYKKDDEE
ncbi:hypothetical protein [Acinetobacter pittii]|uniref:hypothetical protein n=1 Tax=Acinetobacter pittii TaxID=48296 RepID=UPI00388D05F6